MAAEMLDFRIAAATGRLSAADMLYSLLTCFMNRYSLAGRGKYTCKNGVCYDGKWRDDQRHGTGTCSYANGDVYEGRWFRNHKHGEGAYKFHNGNTYRGDWRR